MFKSIHLIILLFFFQGFNLYGQKKDSVLISILKLDNSKSKVDKLNVESEYNWQIGQYPLGLSAARNAQVIAHKINYFKGEALAYNNIGIVFDYQGKYAEALENYFKAVNLQKSIKDEDGLAYSYNNIGLIYSNQKNNEEALKFYEKSLYLRKKQNNLAGISSTYNNIGILHMNKKEYDKALNNYFASVKIDSSLHDEVGVSASLSNIGLVYMELDQYEKAHYYFQISLAIREKIKDKLGLANSFNNIGSLYHNENKYPEAKEYLLKGLEIGKELGSKEIIQYSYDNLHEISEKQGNIPEAFNYFKMYILYKDSIQNETNLKKQTEFEMQFKFDQQTAHEKIVREKQDLIDKQKAQQQTFIVWALIVIVIISLLFVLIINKRRKVERSQKHLIEAQKRLVDDKNEEILASITYAKRIQTAILPPEKIVREYFSNSFILYKPKDIVAGDFYWIEPDKDEIIFAVADCTGHGVPGALISVVCHNALNRAVREFKLKDPGDILNKTREMILNEFQKSDQNVNDGMDISICRLNLQTRELKWSGANSPLWIIKEKQDEIIELKPSKQPIGQFDKYIPFETIAIQLEERDSIYLFSDGFADQFGGDSGKKMKSKRMKELFQSMKGKSMIDQKTEINDFFEQWKSNLEQLDDVCVIGIRV